MEDFFHFRKTLRLNKLVISSPDLTLYHLNPVLDIELKNNILLSSSGILRLKFFD